MAQFDANADADAFSKQYDAEQASVKAQEQASKQEPSFIQKWMAPVEHATTSVIDAAVGAADDPEFGIAAAGRGARDAAAGATTGAVNIADAAGAGAKNVIGQDLGEGTANHLAALTSPIWDHAKEHIMNFRDAIAVKDPNIADSLLQAGTQLAVPFAGYSRALSMVHGFANTVAAGALTDASALAPHDMRTADLIALGQHTEGKLGDALRALGPYGLNAYVNYLGDRSNETEAQGRFKNMLDGLGANAVLTPLLHAAGITLKAGQQGLRTLAANGVRNTISDMAPVPKLGPAAQTGAVGVKNNASGESSASLEAISRVADEKRVNLTRHVLHPDETVTPLTGVDAVDAKTKRGHPVIAWQDGTHIILDRAGLSPEHIQGRVNAAKSRGLLPGTEK